MDRISQADWKLRAATSKLIVLQTMAANQWNASAKHNTMLSGTPQVHPSTFATGLPSSTRFGVATRVLSMSMPREKIRSNSKRKYSRLANGTKSSICVYFLAYICSGDMSRGSVILNSEPSASTERKKHD